MGVTAPGRELHARFLKLGTLTGMSLDQIAQAVGQPTAISAMAYGNTLVQWQATGFHLVLLFDKEMRCLSIQHQYANHEPAANPTTIILGIIGVLVILAIAFMGSDAPALRTMTKHFVVPIILLLSAMSIVVGLKTRKANAAGQWERYPAWALPTCVALVMAACLLLIFL